MNKSINNGNSLWSYKIFEPTGPWVSSTSISHYTDEKKTEAHEMLTQDSADGVVGLSRARTPDLEVAPYQFFYCRGF